MNIKIGGPRLKDHILSIYANIDPLINALMNFKNQFQDFLLQMSKDKFISLACL